MSEQRRLTPGWRQGHLCGDRKVCSTGSENRGTAGGEKAVAHVEVGYAQERTM